MEILLSISVALLVGLLMTRVIKPLGLPAVTGYLVAGILIGPYVLGAFGVEGLGFVSMEYVERFGVIARELEESIVRVAERMKSGTVAPEPTEHHGVSPCSWCRARTICRKAQEKS